MKKWIKRLVLLFATIVVVLIGGALVAWYLVRAEPAFYRLRQMSPQQRADAAQSAEEKFIRIQNSAARISAAAPPTRPRYSTAPIVLDGQPVTITFTDAELNAFFEKWSNFQNWKSNYDAYISDPAIILSDGRIILAAKMRDPELVVSLHFDPKINADGRLELELSRILGGRLPLPEAMISKYEERISAALAQRLPGWQRTAKIDSGGIASAGAISASLAKLLVRVFRHESAEPVLYLPVFGQKGSVPVRISDVKVEDNLITLTVRPLTRDEQAALIRQIQQPEPLMAGKPR